MRSARLEYRGRSPAIIAAALVALVLTTHASATVRAGVQLARFIQTERGLLELTICGVRDTLWIDHYVTAVYLPRDETVLAVRDPSVPKAVRLHVVNARYLPDRIPEKWRRALGRELGRKQLARVRDAYRRLSEGDTVTIVYTPGRGVTFSVNDRLVTRARGHAVIDAILESWAEGESPSEKLRQLASRYRCE